MKNLQDKLSHLMRLEKAMKLSTEYKLQKLQIEKYIHRKTKTEIVATNPTGDITETGKKVMRKQKATVKLRPIQLEIFF